MDWQVTIEPVKGKSDTAAHDLPEARTFDVGAEEIVFGRESNCDVVFPPEARMVGGRHGRLYRQESGDYAIEAFGDHYFEVNGYRPEQGQPITGDSTIRFGSAKGPMIRVHMTRGARTDGLLSTLTQATVTPMSKVVAQLKVAVGVLAAVVVIAVGVQWWLQYQANARFERQMTDMRSVLDKEAQASFPSTDFLRSAAFAVILQDKDGLSRVIGTAWPLQPGMLVTNAHVAEVDLKPHEQLFVRKPGSSDDIPVIGKRVHAGFNAFNDFVDEAIKTSSGFASQTKGAAMPSAYDVAILEVNPDADLGKVLEVSDDPAALTPGASLAFAGYPIEGTGAQKLAQLSPNPVLQFGRVTALSDYFLFNADKPNALLVENSLPATGGASGSPIIDASGKVVAILSGGTVDYRGGVRTPSAAMLNYAQRADLIRGVLDPASFDLEAAKAEWQTSLAVFNKHENTVINTALADLKQRTGGPVDKSEGIPESLKTSEAVTVGTLSYRDQPEPVVAGHTYTFIAYGEQRTGTLDLMLLRGGTGVTATHGASWFSSLTFKADSNETLTLRVLGQAKHRVDYKLYTLTADNAVATVEPSAN